MKYLFFLFAFVLSHRCLAAEEYGLVRRVVIFPMQTEKNFEAKADEAWWQMREELTARRRLLVASRQFLIRNDVFQARPRLQPADAILLGKLLDAHAIITSQLEDRTIQMQAYDGGNGLLLWKQDLSLNPSLSIGDQLNQAARRLVRDFEAHLPNQGHVVVDPLMGSPVYIENGIKVVQVDFGPNSLVEVGDSVQWVQVQQKSFEPTFQGGAQINAFAEGTVLRKMQGLAIVQLDRMTKGYEIKEFQMVRVPREATRLAEFRLKDGSTKGLSADLVVRVSGDEENYRKEHRPVATTLSVVGSIAAFLLLAL